MLDQHIQLADIPSQLQLLERLQHLIRFNSNITFISGETGSGKTILIQRLLSLDIESNQSLLSCSPGIRANKARDGLLSQLVSKPLFNPEDNLGESLFRMLDDATSDILLVVDNAHFLPQDLIGELWLLLLENRFQGFNHKINVLLFADPTWCDQQVALLSGKTDTPPIEMDIPSLSEQESHQFVRSILQRADYQAKVENNAAIHRQIEACAGLPANLQRLVDTIVNETPVEVEKVKSNSQLPLIALMVLAALLMSGAFYYFIVPSPGDEVAEPLANNESLAMALLDEPVASVTIDERSDPSVEPSTASLTPDELVASWQDDAPLPNEVEHSDLELDSLEDPRKRVTVPENVIEKLGATSNNDQVEAQVLEQGEELAALTDAQMNADDVTVQSVEQLKQVLTQPAEEATSVSEAEQPKPETPIVTLAPTPSSTVTSSPAIKPGFRLTTAAELKKIPSQHYSLQLAAVSSLPVLKAFVKEHNIEQTATYFKISRKGKTAYLVVHGDYKTRRAAMNDIASLPTNLRTLKPWAKGYKQIQQEAID
ncbi:AAA family ATPase [Motilimonas cestriensis]|uniref:AAA family ATPase n=1 Tax=Motilimonas cestriensis TaxID=2742685 RepID=A0ABS8WBN5_9GAMM|nr:AAA family ATPase [Motilimonas cestriensis]MCE2595001.1 AAA family ATPase [Motilimonas cestriensis]